MKVMEKNSDFIPNDELLKAAVAKINEKINLGQERIAQARVRPLGLQERFPTNIEEA